MTARHRLTRQLVVIQRSTADRVWWRFGFVVFCEAPRATFEKWFERDVR